MIKELLWDSDFFNLKIGEVEETNNIADQDIPFDLIYVKNKTGNTPVISGFSNNFSEIKVLFSKKLKPQNFSEDKIISFEKTNFQLSDLHELAYESGKYSRFLLDSNFRKDKFQKLYKIWVDNSLTKKFADDVLVMSIDNALAGFITYKSESDFAQIGLIAVAPNFQGQGIGRKLLNFVENVLLERNIFELRIPTQLKNEAACSFYKKQGYKVVETTHIMHYWKK